MAKETKETIAAPHKIILPSIGDSKTDQELIDNFLSHSDEEYREMGEEIKIVELKKELESGKITKKFEKPEAMLLIENGYFDILYDNIEHFEGIDKEVLMLMIKNWYSDKLYDKLEYFKGIDKEVVMKYIQEVEGEDLEEGKCRNLEKFKGILDKEIAIFMIKNGYLDTLYENIKHFEGIDREVVMKYIQGVEHRDIEDDRYRSLKKFIGILDKEIAMFMIKNGYFNTLYGNIEHFEGIDKEVLMLLIENGYFDKLYDKLQHFKGIDKEVVMKYIQEVECEDIEDGNYRNLKKFKGILDKEIAMFMIENGYLNTLYNNIGHFKGIDKEVVMRYIQEVEHKDLKKSKYRDLEKLKGMLDKEIAMFMIKNGYLNTLYNNIRHFEGIDKEVVMKYIDKLVEKTGNYENGNLGDKYGNLEKFKGMLDKEIAMFMIENGYHSALIQNLQYFGNDLDNKIASELIDKGYKSQVKKYKEKFKNLSAFTKMRLWGKTE